MVYVVCKGGYDIESLNISLGLMRGYMYVVVGLSVFGMFTCPGNA